MYVHTTLLLYFLITCFWLGFVFYNSWSFLKNNSFLRPAKTYLALESTQSPPSGVMVNCREPCWSQTIIYSEIWGFLYLLSLKCWETRFLLLVSFWLTVTDQKKEIFDKAHTACVFPRTFFFSCSGLDNKSKTVFIYVGLPLNENHLDQKRS